MTPVARWHALTVAVVLAASPVARGDTLPEILSQKVAPQPDPAGAGRAGTVEVIVEVDEGGRVTDASVATATDPHLGRAAREAAYSLVFSPGRHLGRSSGFSAIVSYPFSPGTSATAHLVTVFYPEAVSVAERAQPVSVQPKPAVAVSVEAEEARRVPGTQGDAAKVVESLPGVARPALGSGDLVLWGSAPAESRVFVDGIAIPTLFHLGGLRSVIPSPLIGNVDVVPGAYGVTLGRGLGGLVRVATADLPTGVHGGASLDPLDATIHLSAARGSRWRIGGAWREGLVHHVLGGRLSGDAARLVAVPRMRDQQLKATAIVSDVEEVHALVLASSDGLERSAPSADPADARTEAQSRSFWRAALRYLRLPAEGRSAEAVIWVGRDSSRRDLRFGATPAALDLATNVVGARLLYREELVPALALTAGLDALVSRSRIGRQGSLTVPAREGDPGVFGQPPGTDVNADSWRTLAIEVAPLVSGELALGPLMLVAGGRLEALGLEVSRVTPRVGATPAVGAAKLDWAIDPRITARLAISPRLAFTAAAGRYHQLPSPEDASAVFGNPTLGPGRAEHAALGAHLQIGEHLTAETTGFAKRLEALAARDPTATPPLARVLNSGGRGRSVGVQFLVRLAPARGFSGWLAYTLSKSERRDGSSAPSRLADFDQTHVLALVAGYQRGRWHAGSRFRFATGAPRTPVTGTYYDVAAARFSPVFGPVNSTRLAPFLQVDARLERTFTTSWSTLDIYLELLNVTARRNPEELVYDFDYGRREAITGLPFLTLAGARLRF